ncbi:DUF1389 domain-containing protein [Chlamydia vaughanii]|uniref:DUF1389 domain-containing protein n=1 Tax=Chlamydia vaughanii TaxID=3112552 RepID=UPI0032B2A562
MKMLPISTESVSQPVPVESRSAVTNLRKHALAISAAVFSLISLILIAVVACGMAHPAVIITLLLSLVLAVALISLAIRSYKKPTVAPGKALPLTFLNVIKNKFPKDFFQFCFDHPISLQELQDVVDALSTNNFDLLSTECRKKIEKFGIQRLQKGFSKEDLRNLPQFLENSMISGCIMCFMKRFVELGSPDCVEPGMPPEIYWFAPLGLQGPGQTIFSLECYLLAKVITKREWGLIQADYQNKTWSKQSPLLDSIKQRMLAELNQIDDFGCFPSHKDRVRRNLIDRNCDKILCVFHHGINWDQLQLLRHLNPAELVQIVDFECRDLYLGAVLHTYAQYLDKSSPEFDSDLLLSSIFEWFNEAFLIEESRKKMANLMRSATIPLYWILNDGTKKQLRSYSDVCQ